MAGKIRGRNGGSVWKQGNSWRAAVSINGNRITKSFKTKAECNSWIHEKTHLIQQGLIVNRSSVTLGQYLTDWLRIHTTTLKPKSGQRYEQIARDYILPYLGNSKIQDLRVVHIEALYQQLLKKGVSVRNVRYVHSLLHRCLKDAVIRGQVGLNAAHGARQPRLKQTEMKILDESQVVQFFIAVQNDRNEALYHLAIKTGMRMGELLGLNWSDLDWNKQMITIHRQVQRVKGQGMVFMSPKTKAGRRSIVLGDETINLLREHKARQLIDMAVAGDRWRDSDLIFPSSIGTPQSSSNLLKSFKENLINAGLPVIRFHDLRHTAASLMLNRGVPAFVVSKILGHSKPSTTMDIYGHLIPVMNEGVGNLMDELLTPISVNMGEKLSNSRIHHPNKP